MAYSMKMLMEQHEAAKGVRDAKMKQVMKIAGTPIVLDSGKLLGLYSSPYPLIERSHVQRLEPLAVERFPIVSSGPLVTEKLPVASLERSRAREALTLCLENLAELLSREIRNIEHSIQNTSSQHISGMRALRLPSKHSSITSRAPRFILLKQT